MSERNIPHERRRKLGGFDITTDSGKTHVDPETGRKVVKLFTGDCYISTSKNEMLATILGSCISACIRDPLLEIGGMNHFLLPGDSDISNPMSSARYGVNAMEQLLNGLYKLGAVKKRLEVKVFGGGNVMGHSSKIGTKNSQFIMNFLTDEGFSPTAKDLEGENPRRLHYYPDTGKVKLRKLRRKEDFTVVEEEKRYTKAITVEESAGGDIDLF